MASYGRRSQMRGGSDRRCAGESCPAMRTPEGAAVREVEGKGRECACIGDAALRQTATAVSVSRTPAERCTEVSKRGEAIAAGTPDGACSMLPNGAEAKQEKSSTSVSPSL